MLRAQLTELTIVLMTPDNKCNRRGAHLRGRTTGRNETKTGGKDAQPTCNNLMKGSGSFYFLALQKSVLRLAKRSSVCTICAIDIHKQREYLYAENRVVVFFNLVGSVKYLSTECFCFKTSWKSTFKWKTFYRAGIKNTSIRAVWTCTSVHLIFSLYTTTFEKWLPK